MTKTEEQEDLLNCRGKMKPIIIQSNNKGTCPTSAKPYGQKNNKSNWNHSKSNQAQTPPRGESCKAREHNAAIYQTCSTSIHHFSINTALTVLCGATYTNYTCWGKTLLSNVQVSDLGRTCKLHMGHDPPVPPSIQLHVHSANTLIHCSKVLQFGESCRWECETTELLNRHT